MLLLFIKLVFYVILLYMQDRTYIAIDLKSFYASVECVERNLDPLTTNLVVADTSRTEKTICLAVSPSLKSYGIKGRPRLFEVVQKVKSINAERRLNVASRKFCGKSFSSIELNQNTSFELSYIAATPRMSLYIRYSTKVYATYLKYVSPEDIHVYSIDEVFIDATSYLKLYKITAHDLAMKMIKDVLSITGVTATAGIGTNLYLAKIAMDIVAKHEAPDKDGVRIAFLDEMKYRRELWGHEPLTDFWRVGYGYQERLNKLGLKTMGDIARISIQNDNTCFNEELLYKEFGINAELLIDHAWGYESCTIKDIKSYKPSNSSLSTGQVLQCAYTFDKARIVVKEMAESLALDLLSKKLLTNQVTLYIGYDKVNAEGSNFSEGYNGEVVQDYYGRIIPKSAHGGFNFTSYTSSLHEISNAVDEIFCSIVDKNLTVRRINIGANNLLTEEQSKSAVQLDLFAQEKNDVVEKEKEKKISGTILDIQSKFGKNSLLKGMSLQEGATQRQRNTQIGGHKS